MKLSEMRESSAAQLEALILELSRERFNLRLQRATSGEVPGHNIRRVRREIAQAKTILREKALKETGES